MIQWLWLVQTLNWSPSIVPKDSIKDARQRRPYFKTSPSQLDRRGNRSTFLRSSSHSYNPFTLLQRLHSRSRIRPRGPVSDSQIYTFTLASNFSNLFWRLNGVIHLWTEWCYVCASHLHLKSFKTSKCTKA